MDKSDIILCLIIKKEKEDTRDFMTFESPEGFENYRKRLFEGSES